MKSRSHRLVAAALATLWVTFPGLAEAFRQPRGISGDGLETAPGVTPIRRAASAELRRARDLAVGVGRARRVAWDTFLAEAGDGWWASWDEATDVPIRIFGRGLPAPGAVADATLAEAHARAFLRRHAALLAPGVAAHDLEVAFQLTANDLDGPMRTVAFAQRALGAAPSLPLPIDGASVSFRYKNDRLFVVASSAVPGALASPVQVAREEAERAALSWAAGTHGHAAVAGEPSMSALPLRRSASFELITSWQVTVEADAPRARYSVWVDARTGRPVARQQLLRFAQGTMLFDAPVRGPAGERQLWPAPMAELSVDGATVHTDSLGVFSWATAAPANIQVRPYGNLVDVVNQAGNDAVGSFAIADGGQALWSLADDELGDAQLSAYVHTNVAKARARQIAPELAFLDDSLPVRVNKDEPDYYCNAYWDGGATNFSIEAFGCNNTARLADVVYHEFGHALHQYALIPDAGAYDGSLSEGASDYLAATITGDPMIAPEFQLGGGVLREIDSDRRWPDDISYDSHETGLIFAGAVWDMRQLLGEELGHEGIDVADRLYLQALRRASDIPTTYVEVLAADDDDGDLENGTPHVCAITEAFVRHNLAGAVGASGLTLTHEALALLPPGDVPYPVRIHGDVRWPQCAGRAPAEVRLVVQRRDTGAAIETVPLSADGDDFVGEVQGKPQGSAWSYRVEAESSAGIFSLPDNAADREYRFFVGEVEELWCTDFEEEPTDWVLGDVKGGPGDFEWGTPAGEGGDPNAAFSGAKVIGNDLGNGDSQDGRYRPKKVPFLEGPLVDRGDAQHVRLQFRRWLTVEDGYFDQASVLVNGAPLWQNEGTDENNGALNHRDREWRLEDIDVSTATIGDPTLQVRFELESDAYTELGGWNIDDVCFYRWEPPPPPEMPKGEEPEQDAPSLFGEGLGPGGGCGCRATGGESNAGWLLGALVGVLVGSRRSRRRAKER